MSHVKYVMSGPAHLPYLVVSLMTLREHYTGPVRVHAWPESWQLAQRIAADDRLNVEAVLNDPVYRGKNAQFLHKIQLVQCCPRDEAILYLDADTSIHHSLEPLFAAVDVYGLVLTQFHGWRTPSRVLHARISRLFGKPELPQAAIERVLTSSWPSPNGGIWASRPNHPLLPVWHAWTWAARDVFIADEACLHILQVEYPDQLIVLQEQFWNCSHKFCREPERVKIWHYHGDSNVRPDKSPAAVAQWWPLYQRAKEANLGGLAEWYASVSNRWLAKMEG